MATQIDTSDHVMSYDEFDHKLPQRSKIEKAFTTADYSIFYINIVLLLLFY